MIALLICITFVIVTKIICDCVENVTKTENDVFRLTKENSELNEKIKHYINKTNYGK